MAEEGQKKITVKNPNIKKIFETMEYGPVTENVNLSKVWLSENQKGAIYSYIDNKAECLKGKATEIKDVYTNEFLATVYSPDPQDVEKIILKSFQTEQTFFKEIKTGFLLDKLAKEIERNVTLFCQLEVSIRGILSVETKTQAIPLLVEYLQYYASWAVKYAKQPAEHLRKDVTVSIISDENFLAVFGFVLGPALAAGYNVILQTEPKISAVATLIIELAESVGFPEGVIKLLPGSINLEPIIKHQNVEVVSCFGNLFKSKYDLERPLLRKFLTISTSSKTPMIVFNNGDIDSACNVIVKAAWGYQGMLPWSLNTVIVQEDIFENFVNKLKYRLSKVNMGNATDKMADVSYPVRTDALKELQFFINEAKMHGIEVFQSDPKCENFQPTLFIGGRVFGNNVILEDRNIPSVTVLAFRTTNEAVSLANNSRYGFGASVWTENIGLANEVSKKLDVGNVWINCYGNFTATKTMTFQKQSGIGNFGGEEGFKEYIDADHFIGGDESGLTFFHSKQHVIKPVQSFYGGSFKKSESGLMEGAFERPVGKDLCNAVAAAKKGQEIWGKMSFLNRIQLLKRVADEIAQNKTSLSESLGVEEHVLKDWILNTYEASAELPNLGNVSQHNSYELRSYKEPIGIIAVEEFEELNNDGPFVFLLCTLLLGNAVVFLNYSSGFPKFYVELAKIFSMCNIPAGVFNVIVNCNKDVFKTMMLHKELNAFNLYSNYEIFNKTKIKDLKHLCVSYNDWFKTSVMVTKTKNIWSNIGDSFM